MKSLLWNEGYESILVTSSVQASSTNRMHITKSPFLFVTGFFVDRSIYLQVRIRMNLHVKLVFVPPSIAQAQSITGTNVQTFNVDRIFVHWEKFQ